MSPITRKSTTKLVTQFQTRTFKFQKRRPNTYRKVDKKKPENKRVARLGWTAIYLSLICIAVMLGWTDCHTFVSYFYDNKAWEDWLPYICLLFIWKWCLGGLTAKHLSLICMTVRLRWTDCHTFVTYLYDSKAWVDWLPYICRLFVWQ